MSSKWVQSVLNWMEAFGTCVDVSPSSNSISNGWVGNLGEFQINFELRSGKEKLSSKLE